eukprot:1790102-Rhodomonas_salina.12
MAMSVPGIAERAHRQLPTYAEAATGTSKVGTGHHLVHAEANTTSSDREAYQARPPYSVHPCRRRLGPM